MRFSQVQRVQTKQLWVTYSSRMRRLQAHRQQILRLMREQEASNGPWQAVVTAPAMVEPAVELMDNVRLQQEVLLPTMRVFIYSVCTPWQFGQLVAFMHPFQTDMMDLIKHVLRH